MTAVLPRGLINANLDVQQYALNDPDTNFSNAEAVRRFWRVYAVQSEFTRDGAATRSRNLFWRIWSSPKLTDSITPPRLTRLWQRCSHQFDWTPIAGLPALLPPTGSQDPPTPRQARNRSASLSPSTEVRPGPTSSPRGGQNVSSTLQGFAWSEVNPQARGHAPRLPFRPVVDLSGQRSDSTSGSTSQTTSDSSSRPTLSRTASGGRQRQPVVAHAGKARARPSIPRRKSSSQKPAGAPSQPKSPRGQSQPSKNESSEAIARAERLAAIGPPPGLPVPSTTGAPAFALPSASSWQDIASPPPGQMATTPPTQSPTSPGLVEPDFRGKFVETQKMLSSSGNLAGLGRMRRPGSIVRFADEEEETGKGKEREGPTSPVREENLGPSRLRTSMASAAISDGSDSESDSSSDQMELPRTKSQLSLLIRNRRSETGSSDIGPAGQTKESKGKEKEVREKAKSKEEELLSMGRRDGVTKAGGVQVPKQQRVSELDDTGYASPSSPEPLF
ncbi:hypothetical protein H2200_004668 [Cladophialophora chaetospira]|uniref:Nitrogen regulatory protein areA GATA-like domain-containing protein n=1 Tax=Cladophialophora chaetospira TaxID=386627 RepID=A0AA38XDR4_9EURO|nr:hypothetical protein H2200_004668 [Cladophialophora chaetospira]